MRGVLLILLKERERCIFARFHLSRVFFFYNGFCIIVTEIEHQLSCFLVSSAQAINATRLCSLKHVIGLTTVFMQKGLHMMGHLLQRQFAEELVATVVHMPGNLSDTQSLVSSLVQYGKNLTFVFHHSIEKRGWEALMPPAPSPYSFLRFMPK